MAALDDSEDILALADGDVLADVIGEDVPLAGADDSHQEQNDSDVQRCALPHGHDSAVLSASHATLIATL